MRYQPVSNSKCERWANTSEASRVTQGHELRTQVNALQLWALANTSEASRVSEANEVWISYNISKSLPLQTQSAKYQNRITYYSADNSAFVTQIVSVSEHEQSTEWSKCTQTVSVSEHERSESSERSERGVDKLHVHNNK